MARGIYNSIFGGLWARRLAWIYFVWVALNLTLFRGLLSWKFMGVNNILSWIYAVIFLGLAWDIYHNAI